MPNNRLRQWIEDRLPWFDPVTERVRNAETEAIQQRSINVRVSSEQVIADYREASELAHIAIDTTVEASRVIDRQHVIDSYEQAERQRVRAKP